MELLKENSRLKEALLSHMFISYATSTKISDRFVDVGELRSLGFSDVELQTYIEVHKDE